MRTVAIFAAVTALVATVALPAFAGAKSDDKAQATTLQQLAVNDAQSLVVASEATAAPMERGDYAATTPDEIAKKKAEEAAAKRAAEQASVASSGGGGKIDTQLVSPGSGEVRYPLPAGSWRLERTLSATHQGADLSGPAGTPIFAATSGVVRISTESHYSYGVTVIIDSVVGGQRVSTLYAHMIHGSRQVQAGQTVTAGQVIGQRGSTGRSTGPHLHFEVRVNNTLVEPMGWLRANAG